MQIVMRKLAHLCYTHSLVPLDWKITSLYPIPKPTDWNFSLAHTRPIILIECLRKLIMKILGNRLSDILSKFNVLRGPNFAGLKNESTDIPIHILNGIMEEARDNKQELWIIFQDMAKAFDSVGLIPLAKTLERIKIPNNIISFIIDNFKNRKISVITAYGISEPFVGEDGIDQGETISPLLWRIFYDPLLCRIQDDESLGVWAKLDWPSKDIHRPIMEFQTKVGTSAFADDTLWLANNKCQAQKTIDISNEFYIINDIKINGKKSELIVMNSKLLKEEQWVLMGKDQDIVYANKLMQDSRFLGIWINSKLDQKSNIQRIGNVISDFVNTTKGKKATAAQFCYIYNGVIIPKVEYLHKITHLSDTKCHNLEKIATKYLKNRFHLPITANDNILFHKGLIGIKHLWDNYKEYHITSLIQRLNSDKKDGIVTEIRLRRAQLMLNLTEPIWQTNRDIPIDMHLIKHNIAITEFIAGHSIDMGIMCINQEINFKMEGSGITSREAIMSYIDNMKSERQNPFNKEEHCKILNKIHNLKKSLVKLSERGIFYVNDIISPDGQQVLTWNQTNTLTGIGPKKGATPKCYLALQECAKDICEYAKHHNSNNSQHQKLLVPEDQKIQETVESTLANIPSFLPKLKKLSNKKNKQEFMFFFNKEQSYFGRAKKKTNAGFIFCEHWIAAQEDYENNKLVTCIGCSLSIKNPQKYDNSSCIIRIHRENSWLLENAKRIPGINNTLKLALPISLYKRSKTVQRSTLSSTEIEMEYLVIMDLDRELINKAIDNKHSRENLTNILSLIEIQAQDMENSTNNNKGKTLTVYTDGSLSINGNNNKTKMGYGWISLENQQIKHYGYLERWPSSTCAELTAIWTMILATPSNFSLKIKTDSQAAIDAIITAKKINSRRKWFTINNRSLVNDIITLINKKNIDLELIKVKAHSGILGNEMADELAKRGSNSIETKIDVDSNRIGSLEFIPTWNNIPIEKKIRKFVSTSNIIHHQALWQTNRDIRDFKFGGSFDTKSGFQQIDNIKGFNCNSWKKHSSWIRAIKLMNNLIPTLDILQDRYPDIITHTKCLFCNEKEESLLHLTLCNSLDNTWYSIINKSTKHIEQLVKNKLNDHISTESINRDLKASRNNNGLSNTLSNLIRGFIPDSMMLSWKKKGYSNNKHISIFNHLIKSLQDHFYQDIWKLRCDKWLLWQRENNVNIKMMIKMHINRRVNTVNLRNITLTAPSNWILNAWDDDLEDKMINNPKRDRKGRIILTKGEKLEWGREIWKKTIEDFIEVGQGSRWIYNRIKDILGKGNKENKGDKKDKKDKKEGKKRTYNLQCTVPESDLDYRD